MADGARRVALAGEDHAHRVLAATLLDRSILRAAPKYGGWPEVEQLDQARAWYQIERTVGPTDPPGTPQPFYRIAAIDDDMRTLTGRKFFRIARFEDQPLGEASSFVEGYRLFALQLDPPDVVVLLRDADNDPERISALPLARRWVAEHCRKNPRAPAAAFGVTAPIAEAWFVACLSPAPDRHAVACSALSFDPCRAPERLAPNDRQASHHAKRVLRFLQGEGDALDQAAAVALKAGECEALASCITYEAASVASAATQLPSFLACLDAEITPILLRP